MNRPIKHPPIGALTNPCVSTSAAPVPPLHAGAANHSANRCPPNTTRVGGLNGNLPIASLPTPLATCPDCDGTGEAMILALDATREEVGYCDTCQGTGEVEATCETCAGQLVDGWCEACEDYGLVFVERISPTRVAL